MDIETYVIVNDGFIVRVYETSDGIIGIKQAMINENIQGECHMVSTPFSGNVGDIWPS